MNSTILLRHSLYVTNVFVVVLIFLRECTQFSADWELNSLGYEPVSAERATEWEQLEAACTTESQGWELVDVGPEGQHWAETVCVGWGEFIVEQGRAIFKVTQRYCLPRPALKTSIKLANEVGPSFNILDCSGKIPHCDTVSVGLCSRCLGGNKGGQIQYMRSSFKQNFLVN